MKKIFLLTVIMISFLSSAHSCPDPITPTDLEAMRKNVGEIQEKTGRWWKAILVDLKDMPLNQIKEIKLKIATGARCTYDVSFENSSSKGSFILGPKK